MQQQEHCHGVVRGWTARLADGRLVTEHSGTAWTDVKESVVWLGLDENGTTTISLPEGQNRYLQGKTGSCGLTGGKIEIESRWIGFETASGSVVRIRVIEGDGRIEVEV